MFFTIFLSLLLSSTNVYADRTAKADKIAAATGFSKSLIKTDTFLLTTYQRIQTYGEPLRIYIEGDGRAWVRKRLSLDPTPKKPLILKLASIDPSENVAYIARPCQYTPKNIEPYFDSAYWTNKRFSETVIASMDQAITSLKNAAGSEHIELIGYSGGGAVTVLVTARRNDITQFATIAGNLDHEAINAYHKVKPLKDSLNPIDVTAQISQIPQKHFIGNKDKVIPGYISKNFVEKLGPDAPCEIIVAHECSHSKGWEKIWLDLLNKL